MLSPLIVSILLGLLFGCGRSSNTAQIVNQSTPLANTSISNQAVSTAEPAPIATPTLAPVASSASYDVDQSLQQSVANAQVIVVAQVDKLGEVVNTDKDAQDYNKPASDSFGVGQTYNVLVKQYLKGNGETTLTILNTEGAILSPPELITQSDIERAKAAYGEKPLVPGKTYLMLLAPLQYYPSKSYYGGQGNPWLFVLNEDGSYSLDAGQEVIRQLGAYNMSDVKGSLVDYIKQRVAADAAAKPTP